MKFLILFLFTLSCATKQTQNPDHRLFPFGTYKETISLEKDGKLQSYPSTTIWSKENFILNVYAQDGRPLIEYQERFQPLRKTVTLDESVPLTQEKATFYFSYLKFLYSLDRTICKEKTCHWEFMGATYDFELDGQGAVEKVLMTRGEKKMNVTIDAYSSSTVLR